MVCRLQGIDVCNTFASQSIFHSLHGAFLFIECLLMSCRENGTQVYLGDALV